MILKALKQLIKTNLRTDKIFNSTLSYNKDNYINAEIETHTQYENRKDVFRELNYNEYKQLIVFKKLNRYEELCTTSKAKNFSKKDKMWSIYNDVILEEQDKGIIENIFIALFRMSEVLFDEKKHSQSLVFYLNALYLICYNYNILNDKKLLITRHFNKKRKKRLAELLEKSNNNIFNISVLMKNSVKNNIPIYYDEQKINYICCVIKEIYLKEV